MLCFLGWVFVSWVTLGCNGSEICMISWGFQCLASLIFPIHLFCCDQIGFQYCSGFVCSLLLPVMSFGVLLHCFFFLLYYATVVLGLPIIFFFIGECMCLQLHLFFVFFGFVSLGTGVYLFLIVLSSQKLFLLEFFQLQLSPCSAPWLMYLCVVLLLFAVILVF